MRYRKRPVVIEAIQLRWDTWSEMCDHAGVGHLEDGKPQGTYLDEHGKPSNVPITLNFADGKSGFKIGLIIPTLEGVMVAQENDWIIKGIKGEFYPCKPDIFEATYEAAE